MKEPYDYTPEDIKAWLESVPGEKIIGTCRDPQDCLIANFLEAEGYKSLNVQPYRGHYTPPYIAWKDEVTWNEVTMPEALQDLAIAFDNIVNDERPIAAYRALELFD